MQPSRRLKMFRLQRLLLFLFVAESCQLQSRSLTTAVSQCFHFCRWMWALLALFKSRVVKFLRCQFQRIQKLDFLHMVFRYPRQGFAQPLLCHKHRILGLRVHDGASCWGNKKVENARHFAVASTVSAGFANAISTDKSQATITNISSN